MGYELTPNSERVIETLYSFGSLGMGMVWVWVCVDNCLSKTEKFLGDESANNTFFVKF